MSFGSRHSVVVSTGINHSTFAFTLLMITYHSSSVKKYLSNFLRNRISINASIVLSETATLPDKKALSNTFRDVGKGSKAEGIMPFVSTTKSFFTWRCSKKAGNFGRYEAMPLTKIHLQ